MQKRQLWLLNAALAGFAILMAMRLASDWKRANERYIRLAERSAIAASRPVVPLAERPTLLGAEVTAKNLFTPGRNNDRPQETRLQAQPPLPVVIGTLRLGAGYEALMSEAGGAGAHQFRRVKHGDQLGPYTVAEIRDEAVVVEFEGQKTTVNVYQSARTVARAAASAVPPAPPAPAGPVVETTGAPTPAAILPAPAAATATTPTSGAAGAGFTDVKVTIEGNRKRYERNTAFGPQVWYEDIK